MKALIIKRPWIDQILSGTTTWEIRDCSTNTRGTIELIQSGSGLVVGACEIVDCIELTIGDYKNNIAEHGIKKVESLSYKKTFAWVIAKAKRYKMPKIYKHPKGAIIWINL